MIGGRDGVCYGSSAILGECYVAFVIVRLILREGFGLSGLALKAR
jgi:hypothetical protein